MFVFVFGVSQNSIHGLEKGYYADGEDAYDMRKPLTRQVVSLPSLGAMDAMFADTAEGLALLKADTERRLAKLPVEVEKACTHSCCSGGVDAGCEADVLAEDALPATTKA